MNTSLKVKAVVVGAVLLGQAAVAPLALAQGGCGLSDFKGLVNCTIATIFNPAIALIMGIALLAFLLGVLKYITKGADPKERAAGAGLMWYGIVGFFVMLSVWGFVRILSMTFFNGGVPVQPPIPTINVSSQAGQL